MSGSIVGHIEHPSAWMGRDLVDDPAWIFQLSARDLGEIEAAMVLTERRGLATTAIGLADFPLPTLGPRLAGLLEEVRDGRGFVVLRGLPVAEYGAERAARAYWGLGTHFGTAVRQNPAGDLLGEVRNKGKRWGELGVRGPDTNGQLNFHTDYADIVGLVCLGKARSGGLSRIASSVTLHNELRRRHPEHLPLLYRGFRYIKREAVETAEPVTGHLPVFAARDGVLSCRFIRERIEAAAVKLGQPLTEAERAALDCVAGVVGQPGVHLDMDLELGDIQLINNYTVLHARTSFEDGELPHEKRHLLRLWLTFHGARRPMAEGFPPANGYAVPGAPPPEGAVALGLTS